MRSGNSRQLLYLRAYREVKLRAEEARDKPLSQRVSVSTASRESVGFRKVCGARKSRAATRQISR